MEIERKILGINVREVMRRIAKLRPKPQKLFDGLIRVKYFDFPDHSIKKKHDLLRVRELRQKSRIPVTELVYKVYKGIRGGCKCYEEFEQIFEGPKKFAEICVFLEQLGFMQTIYYEKKRTLFKWTHVIARPRSKSRPKQSIYFEIDEHPKIPPFMEIEAPSPAAVKKAIRTLGLQSYEQSALSISELLKKKYPKVKLNGLRFSKRAL